MVRNHPAARRRVQVQLCSPKVCVCAVRQQSCTKPKPCVQHKCRVQAKSVGGATKGVVARLVWCGVVVRPRGALRHS